MGTENLGRVLVIHRGQYSESAAYIPLDEVSYNGSTYRCYVACTGVAPTTTSKWRLVCSKGTDGTNTSGGSLTNNLQLSGSSVAASGSSVTLTSNVPESAFGNAVISSVIFVLPDKSEVPVATLPALHTLSVNGNAGDDIVISAYSKDSLGNTYNTVDFIITIQSQGVITPSIISPLNNASDVVSSASLTASAFKSFGGLTHSATSWQVSTNSTFDNIVFESLNDTQDITSIAMTGLIPDTQYYARVKYHSGAVASGYSSPIAFSIVNAITGIQASSISNNRSSSQNFGRFVSISGDGNTAAIISPGYISGSTYYLSKLCIYSKFQGAWALIAELDIPAISGQQQQGPNPCAISDDGNKAVVISNNYDSGFNLYQAKIIGYDNFSGSWEKVSETVLLNQQFRSASLIDLSADSSTLAISNDYLGSYVFAASGNAWTQSYDAEGKTNDISLSADGSVMASVGINGLYIENRTSGAWVRSKTFAEYAGYHSCSLSDDGNKLAIGKAGTVKLLEFNTSTYQWVVVATLTSADIVGESTSYFGYSVKLSGNGNVLLVSDIYDYKSGSAISSGLSHIFRRGSSTVWSNQPTTLISSNPLAEERLGSVAAINTDGSDVLLGAGYLQYTSTVKHFN